MPPNFKNRRNEPIQREDGSVIWHSRSVAVVAEICLYQPQQNQWYILIGQRGSGTPDFQGYWGLPCGYLDWNETLCEAVVREVWEECGLFLPELSQQNGFIYSASSLLQNQQAFNDTPWAVTDHLGDNKQNISLHFAAMFGWGNTHLPELSNINADPDEVSGLAWQPITQAMQMQLAFNHHLRIRKVLDELQSPMAQVEKHCQF